ncbi:hypothetical protein [Cohaesibacter haloalkalitolerans]|uniref:hypothetical protein n=1 Tax=Cohaesibacter haloalkalitolerans TaxID=1162980 RepID=UPI0013C4CA9C|nr:hypothetical protein [Cohaesibacter haloalkalitolerans]
MAFRNAIAHENIDESAVVFGQYADGRSAESFLGYGFPQERPKALLDPGAVDA